MAPSKATESIKAILISSAPRLEAPGPHLNGVLPGNAAETNRKCWGWPIAFTFHDMVVPESCSLLYKTQVQICTNNIK